MAFFIMPIMVCLAVCPLLMDNRDMEITIRFGNTGLFSTFMSYVAIIYVQSRNLKINKTEIMILLIVFSVIFLLFKSRTSILILSLGLFSTLLRRKVNVQFCKILGVALLLIFSIVTYSFFNENKYNSACGRLLIQKVCALNLKHVPIMGYGLNSFSRVYPLLQEKYYREGNMTEQENRLAGDVRYAFNEFVQIFFEFGILGIMVVFLFLFFIIKWHQTGFLFVILPPLLFSYPLHNDYLIFIILYLWVNYSHTSNEKEVQPSCGCVL